MEKTNDLTKQQQEKELQARRESEQRAADAPLVGKTPNRLEVEQRSAQAQTPALTVEERSAQTQKAANDQKDNVPRREAYFREDGSPASLPVSPDSKFPGTVVDAEGRRVFHHINPFLPSGDMADDVRQILDNQGRLDGLLRKFAQAQGTTL